MSAECRPTFWGIICRTDLSSYTCLHIGKCEQAHRKRADLSADCRQHLSDRLCQADLWSISRPTNRLVWTAHKNKRVEQLKPAYVTFIKRQGGDCLVNWSNFDAFYQAGFAISARRCRRRSQNHVLVYDALERTHEDNVHDASNRVQNYLDSVDHDVIEPIRWPTGCV